MKDFLSTREAAAKLYVSPSTLTTWAQRGYISAIRVGIGRGRLRFKPEDIERLAAGEKIIAKK